jgi:predicted transcriptional regulator
MENQDETQADWWDEIPQAARESILRGLADAEAGRVYSHDEVMKPYENMTL